MFIGPCIIVIVEEWKTNLMSLAILFHFLCGARFASWSCASACKTSTTQNQPHQISNTQRTENKTTDVVIHQHSRKLLMIDILMSETCWSRKKWNKIASDIKLVFHSSTIDHCIRPNANHGLIRIFVWCEHGAAVACTNRTPPWWHVFMYGLFTEDSCG